MKEGPDIALNAALIGDPARANILAALMGGQALTASELASEAGVTPQTASGHLAQLLDGGLVRVAKQGRHRYYALAGPDVGAALEALMHLAVQADRRRVRAGPRDPALREARVCYDHLAGARGVELFARLCDARFVALEGGLVSVTQRGEEWFGALGVDVAALRRSKRPLCRTCLDWSERRFHLAGSLGSRMLERFFERDFVRRIEGTRILRFTPSGEAALADLFAPSTTVSLPG
jgi:DNA-binding transcriptional ArsR family regulator